MKDSTQKDREGDPPTPPVNVVTPASLPLATGLSAEDVQKITPRIFSAVTNALQWILAQKGLKVLHYLDDFIIVSGSYKEAAKQMQLLIDTFKLLGIPLETSKLEGPATCLTFLDIEFDTVNLQIRLPPEKLSNLQAELAKAVSCKCITKKSLQSLTGLLQHATKVIRPGRAFLRRLFALQSVGSSPSHHIRSSLAARGIYYGGMSLQVAGMVSPYCGIVLESP